MQLLAPDQLAKAVMMALMVVVRVVVLLMVVGEMMMMVTYIQYASVSATENINHLLMEIHASYFLVHVEVSYWHGDMFHKMKH